jgi:UDP-glucose 4-epimerase
MSIKNIIARHPVLRYRVILELWKLAKLCRWAARHPVFSRWVKPELEITSEDNEAIIIPVQQAIRGTESTVLPYQILKPIVEKADGHMLLGRCPCRNAEKCESYPHDFGCLFLGKSVTEVSSKIGFQTNAAGAMAHVDQALKMGLVPMIVHASFDAALISVPYEKMLAICFCCECCCTIRHSMRLGPSTFDDTMQRLPGLTVKINQDCVACGDCHTVCPVNAIHFQGSLSVIDQDRCKGCGVCAAICPEGAPRLFLDESIDVVEKLVDRIRTRAEIGL